MNLNTREVRERHLRMKLADPIRRIQPQPRSVHIWERTEDAKYSAGNVIFWHIIGVVCGMILGAFLR